MLLCVAFQAICIQMSSFYASFCKSTNQLNSLLFPIYVLSSQFCTFVYAVHYTPNLMFIPEVYKIQASES